MNERTRHPLRQAEQGGKLHLGSLRYLLLRPETLAEIQKGVEDRLGAKSAEFIYAAGASWAVGTIKRLRPEVGEDRADAVELAKALCRHAGELGWGVWTLHGFEGEKRSLAVRVEDSPFAQAYGESDRPACHLIAGAVGGLAESLFNLPTTCNEIACRSQGEPDCRFVATGHDVVGAESWSW